MNTGRTVFSQLIDFLPEHRFRRCVRRYDGERRVAYFLVLGPVPLSCFRTIDLSRELTRYRHLLACTWRQTLPRRYSRAPLAQHFRRRERKTRLAHLCRFCTNPHRQGQRALSEREPLRRAGKHCLRLRLNNRGSLPFFVSLGAVPSRTRVR